MDEAEAALTPRRRGAVGVVYVDGRFLVIRRSATVVAPRKFCFPGGAIEPGETEQEALVRELEEEIGVCVTPVRSLWCSVTPWQVELCWWLAEIPADLRPTPNPEEVETIHWLTSDEMLALPDLLESNRAFLAAIACGEICLETPPAS